MKKLIVVCCVLFTFLTCSACASTPSYEDGYKVGYSEGYSDAERSVEVEERELQRNHMQAMEDIMSEMPDPEDFKREIDEGYWSEEELWEWYANLLDMVVEEYNRLQK